MEFYINNIHPWVREISTYSSLIPIIVGLFLFRKQKTIQFQLLFLFAAVGMLTEAVALITFLLGTKNNLWLGHIYTLASFGIMASIYYFSFDKVLIKRVIIASIVAMIVISSYDAFVLDGLTKVNSISRIFANASLILMAIGYFYKTANSAKVIYLERDPLFLLSCAILIYYAGTSMSYALLNQALAVSWDAARICLAVVFVLNILFYSSQAFILRRMAA